MPAKGSKVLSRLLWQEFRIMDPARDNGPKGGKYRSYRSRLVALVVAVIVVIAGFSIYYGMINRPTGEKTLTVYTYSSFMAYGQNKTNAFNAVFGTFENAHHVKIVIKTPANGILQQLQAEKNNPQADIVIGLTNMNGVIASSQGLLVNYTPPADRYINSSLTADMGSASSYITPYEYSYLGIDYNKSFANGTSFAPNGNFTPSFSNLTNSVLASNLLMENPTTDDTGLGFLLWQIAYYKYVLHDNNWTDWWNATAQYTSGHIYDSWDTAFGYFGTGNNTNLVVSYLTDPAYNQFFGYGNSTGSTVAYHNGKAYGWRTIYGIGIVNGSSNIALDKEFVNYFLSPTVQNEIPTNEWMYPANSTISLPPVFNGLPDQNNIYPLNNYITASDIASNIQAWETQWLNLQ